jgi:hypothetical protein
MSNQRRGNFHKSAASFLRTDAQERELVAFFKRAAETLNHYQHEDAAFYFEQCVDHLQAGGRLSDPIGKILGV